MARRCARTGAAIAMVVLLVGCRAGSGDSEVTESPPSEEPTSQRVDGPVDRSRDIRARIRAQGTGAAVFRWSGEQIVSLIRTGRKEMTVDILSLQALDPEPLPEDRAARFRWGFDLLNTYEDRAGEYTFDSEPGADGKHSAVLFVWMRVKDASKRAVFDMDEVEFLENFTELREPCTLTVGEGERTGTLACPAVANEEGEVAGFTVSWEELGPATEAAS